MKEGWTKMREIFSLLETSPLPLTLHAHTLGLSDSPLVGREGGRTPGLASWSLHPSKIVIGLGWTKLGQSEPIFFR